MSIQTDTLKGIEPINLGSIPTDHWLYSPYTGDKEKEQMRDQIEMLEKEVDRQEIIIDALVRAIKVIERG